jgi:diguanylate cyclase (GGDEF)-like protein/PAS domain S-box-containing protein
LTFKLLVRRICEFKSAQSEEIYVTTVEVKHEGRINDACNGPGRCDAAPHWLCGAHSLADEADAPSFRILLADDEPAVAASVSALIEARTKASVTVVGSGDAALAALRQGRFDVLVTDMSMPGVSGLELIKAAHMQCPETDILVMTGYADAFPYVQVVQAGACDFIGKPHSGAELEAKLLRIFHERALRHAYAVAEHKYRSLFEHCMNGMVLLDQQTRAIMDVNHAFCELSGHDREVFLRQPFLTFLAEEERARFEAACSIFQRGGQGTLGDVMISHKSGGDLVVDMSVSFIDSPVQPMMFLTFKDVTEKRRMEDQLAAATQTDELTGLYNKRALRTRLDVAIDRAERDELCITLLFIDLDDFKHCNDTYGHEVGDRLLARVGEVIRAGIRNGADEGFRYGGDEFAVLLKGAPVDVGEAVAERMRLDFAQGQNYGTTMSIGLVAFEPGMHATDFVMAADRALYAAKAKGKNCTALG